MTQEWKDLPTMGDVDAAQKRGDVVEVLLFGRWVAWDKTGWSINCHYRSRPVPKTWKVKVLCFFNGSSLIWRGESVLVPDDWKRVPAEDKEIEVME
jgi:hypothetical protein